MSRGENVPSRTTHRVPVSGDSAMPASASTARVTGASPWTNSAPPSAG